MKKNKSNRQTFLQQNLIPILLFTLSFVLRLIFFYLIKENASLIYANLGPDSYIYHSWAWRIANGFILGTGSPILNPGYPYILAIIYSIFGAKLFIVSIIQYIIGSFSAVLVYYITLNIFKKTKISLFAGILYSCYGLFIFLETFMVTFVWINFFNLLVIYILTRSKQSFYSNLLCGLLIGISALLRPNVLLLIPFLFFWALICKLKIKKILTITAGTGIIFLLILIINLSILNRFSPTGVSGGINFYIGTSAAFSKTLLPMHSIEGGAGDPSKMLNYFKQKAEEEINRNIGYRDLNKFYFKKGIIYIKNNPKKYIKNLIYKLSLFFSFEEIMSNYSINDPRLKTRIFHVMSYIKYIFPFGFFMMIFYWSKDKNIILLKLYFLVYLFTALIFFVLSEYRLPVIPFIIIYTIFCFKWIINKIKHKNYKKIILCILISFSFYYIGFRNLNKKYSVRDTASKFIAIAENLISKRRFNKAELYLKKAIEYDPENERGYELLGNMYKNENKIRAAENILLKATNFINGSKLYNNLGNLYLLQIKNYLKAKKYYLKSINLDWYNPTPWNGLALAEYKTNNFKNSINIWEYYIKIEPNSKMRKIAKENIEALKNIK